MSLPSLTTLEISNKAVAIRTSGNGPALVLLHGLAGNSRSWVRQFEAFAATHKVIVWDAPGYGGSDDFEPDVDVYTDALDAALKTLGVDEKFVLLGHSMGGILAGRFASRFPEQLLGLILSCTHVGSGNPKGSDLPAGYQNRVNDLNTMKPQDYGVKRAEAMLAEGTPRDIFDLAADISSETRAQGLANAARVLSETDNTATLSKTTLPTLVISGEVDPVVPASRTENLYRVIAHCDKVVIEGAGHAPYLEKPDAFNEALRGFIAKL